MRTTALLLAMLLAFSFAAETATLEYNSPLYRIYTPSYLRDLHVHPYLQFTSELRLSTTEVVIAGGPAADLQEGAIVCEGPITAQLNPRGIWARGSNLEQSLNYYQCEPPAHSGGVRGNRAVEWDSVLYDHFIDLETCTEGSSCWDEFSGLVSQPADYVRTGEWFRNRESSTGVVCRGSSTLRDNARLLDDRSIDLGPASSTQTYARGTYTFTGQMNVMGCMAVVRSPDCPSDPTYVGREEIFSRTSASGGSSDPEYSGAVGPVATTVRVVTDDDLRCSAEFVSVTPDPLSLQPGNSTAVTLTIRNNCPASDPLCMPVTVTRVGVSEGFRLLILTTPGTSWTIRPGSSLRLSGTLYAPATDDFCSDIDQTVNFTVDYTCAAMCGGTSGGTLPTRSTSYRVDYECPPDLTTERPNLVPRFDPDISRIDIPTGERPNLTIITRNQPTPGIPTIDLTSDPGETCVSVGNWILVPTGSGLPGFPPVGMPEWVEAAPPYSYAYPALRPGEEYGEKMDFECTPEMENLTYQVLVGVDCTDTTNESDEFDNIGETYVRCVPVYNPPGEENMTQECDLSPRSVVSSAGTTEYFTLTCPNEEDADELCSGKARWRVREYGNATYADYDGTDFAGWVEIAEDSGPGTLHVEVEIDYRGGNNATCSSDINIPFIPCVEYV